MTRPPAAGEARPSPLTPRDPSEITRGWSDGEPSVSVLCPTYQHAKFIEDAISGFLGQRTSFAFEVIIRDDASTDGTAEIVQDYAKRYPGVIRAVLETENRYPQVDPLHVLRPMARGRYLTICEGDDYWTDPDFLETAYRALEADPAVSGVVGRCLMVSDEQIVGHEHPQKSEWNWYLPVRALLYRADIDIPTIDHVAGDNVIAIGLQKAGKLHHLDRYVAVYRKHSGGVVSGLTHSEFKPKQAAGLTAAALYLAQHGDIELARRYQQQAIRKISWALEHFGVVPEPAKASWVSHARRALGRLLRVVRRGRAD